MTFTFLLIPTYMLALTPVFARGWASFFIGISLFAIGEALLGWLFFSEVQKPHFDDGASVMLAGGVAFMPSILFAVSLLSRIVYIAVKKIISVKTQRDLPES